MATSAEQVTTELAVSDQAKAKRPQLKQRRFAEAAYKRNIFQVIPEIGTTIEDMLDEGYWAHVAVQLKSGDRIEVIAEDNSFFAELFVLSAGRLFAKMTLMRLLEFKDRAVQTAVNSRYTIDFAGRIEQWRFARDGEVLRSGFDTQEQARQAAKDHSDAVNR